MGASGEAPDAPVPEDRRRAHAAHQTPGPGAMDLQITGDVAEILDEKSGESEKGPWRKQDFILETEGQYRRKVCVTQWGDRIEEFDVREGETLTVHIDIESREYRGRWYTDVKAWRVERPEGAPRDAPDPGEPPASDVPHPAEEDDLPF